MLNLEDVDLLRSPGGASRLAYHGTAVEGWLWRGQLVTGGGSRWYLRHGVPQLFEPDLIGAKDRWFRLIYQTIAPLHDAGVRYLLPLLQCSSEDSLREAYLNALELGSLARGRVLEVGVGAGANVPLLAQHLPVDAEIELWGCDLSLNMMRRAARRVERGEAGRTMRFVQADAHHLPFPDNAFDRVFHVGAINSYSDPERALAEMTRVAKPDTPIVAVDEELDPTRKSNLYLRGAFRLLTFYDGDPKSPLHLLPDSARSIESKAISAFYYCLSWRK